MRYLQNLFRFEFESDATASYIVLEGIGGKGLQELQIEMIEQNPNPSILPLSLRVRDNGNRIYYNITSKITLKQLLQKRSLKKREFLDIIFLISRVLIECKNYYAFDKNFALDEELIYINPATLEVSMLYLPVNFDIDLGTVLKNFIKKLLDDIVRIEEEDDLGFIQNIRLYLREEGFNLKDFQKLINQLKGGTCEQPNERRNPAGNRAEPPGGKCQVLQEEAVAPKPVQKNGRIPQKPQIPPPQRYKSGMQPKGQQVKNVFIPPIENMGQQEGTQGKKRYSNNLIIMGAVLQAGVLALIGVVSFIALSGRNIDTGKIGGAVIAAGAADFFIMRRLFDRDKKALAAEAEKTLPAEAEAPEALLRNGTGGEEMPKGREKAYKPAADNINMNKGEMENRRKQNENDLGETGKSVEPGCRQETHMLSRYNPGDTVILDSLPPSIPYLISVRDGVSKKIFVTKPEFVLGRLRGQVDYELTGASISKVHAEIISKNGYFYIKDLNSSNGTYINSKKIKSNFEYEIKNKDTVRFANSEFEFIVR